MSFCEVVLLVAVDVVELVEVLLLVEVLGALDTVEDDVEVDDPE